MTRSLSSTILSLMEDRYLFSMILWVVLLSPSFTTPPGPTNPTPPIIWPCSILLPPFVQCEEPGCSCLIGSLSPPPITTGTVVRMLLLISVWGQISEAAQYFPWFFREQNCEPNSDKKSFHLTVYRDLQSCVLNGCGQGGDPCWTLHGRQHLCAIWFECCQNKWICLQNLRLLDQNLMERQPKVNVRLLCFLTSSLKRSKHWYSDLLKQDIS